MTASAGHDSVHHRHPVAILIIDMMNTLDFPDGRALFEQTRPVARAIVELKKQARPRGIPVIYVNDNFGQWRSSWQEVYEICSRENCLGRELALPLKPEPDDYFVLKPKHSGFYSTTLEVLLEALGVKSIVLTGIAGNICVLFTANDAYMRDYQVVVPCDCVASNSESDNRFALEQLSRVFGIDTRASHELDLDALSRADT